jgi:hypothetical protein
VLSDPAWAQGPTPAPTTATIDGPTADIVSLGGISVARDGTGGLAYLKDVAGVPHVFVSALVGGVFQPPQQLDASLPAASSQPVIAAGNDGVLLVAFINNDSLYVVDQASTTSQYAAPLLLAVGASNPAIQMTNFG